MPSLKIPNAWFFHMPKTGGTWASAALRDQKLIRRVLRKGTDGHLGLDVCDNDQPRIVCTRHPVPWLCSLFRYKHSRKWRDGHALDLACRADTFSTFVHNILTKWPPGVQLGAYQRFVDEKALLVPHDHLAEGLSRALKAVGHRHVTADVLNQTAKRNVSRGAPVSFRRSTEMAQYLATEKLSVHLYSISMMQFHSGYRLSLQKAAELLGVWSEVSEWIRTKKPTP